MLRLVRSYCPLNLLLANLYPARKVPDRYKLEMSEWTDSDSEKETDATDFQPPKKRMTKCSGPI